MANKRKPRKSPFGAVIAVLLGIVILMGIAVLILRLDLSGFSGYPVKFVPEIQQAAAENSIPAPYIAAIIMAESSYDPNAVSSVGARGLMQIMPETGEWIAGKFDEPFDADALFTPQVSIKYGSWYLGFLMERYDGNMRCATAAYHAGQGSVDKWLKDPAYSTDGATLANIPYDSTATYVSRVLKYYDYYVNAYEELEAE